MNETLVATFNSPEEAQRAAGALLDHGIRQEQLSVVLPETYAASDKNAEDIRDSATSGISTTTPEDVSSGAAKGAGYGLAVGVLAALTSIFVPGIGFVLGGGALATAVGGAVATTAGGAVAGGFTGYMKDQGVSDEDIAHHSEVLSRGGATIMINSYGEALDTPTIRGLLEKYGAESVNTYQPAKPRGVVL